MKKTAMFMVFSTIAFNSMGATIDLKSESKVGRFCPTQELSYEVNQNENFVEKMLVSAEGIRKGGFIKVFADGELIHNIGIPGYDPDYSFRVRRNVNNITLKFEETCANVHNVKIFTIESKIPSGYHQYHYDKSFQANWGSELLEMVRSLSMDLFSENDFQSELYPKVLLPMKKIALYEDASEFVRDEKSSITALRALQIAKVVVDNQKFLDRLLQTNKYDYLVRDLLRMKEDILERYDVKEKNIAKTIVELEKQIEE